MMKRFLLKLLIVASPALFVLGLYVYNDPYKVLYHYDSFYTGDTRRIMTLCNDFVSTQTFINKYDKQQYDSYIFGNSRSLFYRVADWQKHINSTKCLHFDAQMEPLWGIESKMRFLKRKGAKIKNAIFVIDHDVLENHKSENFYFTIKHPEISGKSHFSFQWHFLKTFLEKNLLETYIPYVFTKDPKYSGIFLNIPLSYKPEYNELGYQEWEDLIARNPDSFYTPRMHYFYKRDSVPKYASRVIGDEQKALLQSIKKILDENNTEYRIILSPLYSQKMLDTTDLQTLYAIMGKENVFNFTGKNSMTESYYNYYENSHYRSFIAKQILDSIYSKNNQPPLK